ncbi:MAG: C39 family peptidase [Fuerstiella sp.]
MYRYFGDDVELARLIREVTTLEHGGTLAVMLGCHALKKGYRALIYTFNLQVFDPTWFGSETLDLKERLTLQVQAKNDPKLATACEAYIEFLSLGGTIRMQDLNGQLIRRYLRSGIPILTGLSATYLYHEAREVGPDCHSDDLRGEPTGHFVVLCGYDHVERSVLVADPWLPNPLSKGHHYAVPLDRAICSVLLGIVTYDANLLIIRPAEEASEPQGRS